MLSSERGERQRSAGTPRGHAAGLADWLCLAAAPAFAMMALSQQSPAAEPT